MKQIAFWVCPSIPDIFVTGVSKDHVFDQVVRHLDFVN